MKVISFSLWGNNPKYCIGAIRNAELARQIYPDWVCRFYVGDDVPIDILSQIKDVYDNRFTDVAYNMEHRKHHCGIVWGHTTDSVQIVRMMGKPCDWTGMFWRFKSLELLDVWHGEESIEAMIVRDCDSRLSLREKVAVDEWLESDKGWHVMRDHPYHSVPILGGTWGVKQLAIAPAKLGMMINTWNQQNRLQTDQEFLSKEIWCRYNSDFMVHDNGFYTNHWPCHGNIAFPQPRQGLEFVGKVFDEHEKTVEEHETALFKHLKMRGEEVRDWTFEGHIAKLRKQAEDFK